MDNITPKELSLKDQVKQAAQTEINKELFDKAKGKLVDLYRKKAAAEQIVKNIDNEILDYEMQIEGK